MNIIFYDGTCPLCDRAVRFLLKADRKKIFYFAPLGGETAQKRLVHFSMENPSLDTLVLLQGDRFYIEGRGALRIFWLLGGKWRLLGVLSFLPSWLFDPIYRLIARYRYRIFSTQHSIHIDPSRFLP